MDREAVTIKQVAKVMGVSTVAILKRANKENWPHEVLNKRGDRRFPVASLPSEIQTALASSGAITTKSLALLAPEAALTLMNRVIEGGGQRAESGSLLPALRQAQGLLNNSMAVSRPSFALQASEGRPALVGSPDLGDWQNKLALAWADLIRAYSNEKARAKKGVESVMEASELFIKGYNTGMLLPNVFAIVGETSVKSVERNCKKFRDSGFDYTVLAPKWGANKGQSKLSDPEFNTMLSFALHPNKLKVAEVVRLTQMALKKRGIECTSHSATLRRALNNWKNKNYDKWVFCREGEKALNDKCLPYVERNIGFLDVGDVLVADGHVLNFDIMHPFTGKPCRMTMIMWYDWASCMPVGWEIMPTENIQCVAAGLRRAILTLGKMPKIAYLDNGKAFKAKVFTNKDIDFEEAGFYGMFARLGMETVFAWPYNAQSKPVERFFGTFNEIERLMPTYTGASIADKPAHMMRNEKLHRQLHEKKYNGWVPTIEEADQIIAGWAIEYAGRPHKGLKGLCPGEVFASGKGPGMDEGPLRYLMMSMEIKTVHRNGVTFMGRHYYDEALYGSRDRVMIRYDFDDLSRLFVYDITGNRLICEAPAVKQAHPMAALLGGKDDLATVKEGIRQKRACKRATEQVSREFVRQAPTLVVIPERAAPVETVSIDTMQTEHNSSYPPLTLRGGNNKPVQLTRGEAEKIEAEAAKMTLLELKPKAPDLVLTEPDRYEALLERECKGEDLELDDMTFMRYFEKTKMFKTLKDRFEFLRELWLVPEETVENNI